MKRNAGAWLAATAFGALLPWGSAVAADLPVKAKPIVAATFDWSGVYIGAHAGYGGGMKNWETDGANASFVARGPLVGGQIGINKQIGSLVIGAELEGSWADITGAQRIALGSAAVNFSQVQVTGSRIDGIGMLTGRAGVSPADRWFVYAKAGLAVLHEKHDFSQVTNAPPIILSLAGSWNETRFASVVGFGTEYALGNNWSIKGEYNYIYADAKTRTASVAATNGVVSTNVPIDFRIEQAIHLVEARRELSLGRRSDRSVLHAGARGAGHQLVRRLCRRAGRLRLGRQGVASIRRSWQGSSLPPPMT